MIASLVICTVLYIGVTVVLTGMVPSGELGVADPLALALQKAGLMKLAGFFSFGAVIAITAVLLVFQLGQPRIFLSMARDGLLPPFASEGAPALPHAACHDDHDRRRSSACRRCSSTSTTPSTSATSARCSRSCSSRRA